MSMQMLPNEILQIQDALLNDDDGLPRDALDEPDFSVEDTLNQLLEDDFDHQDPNASYEQQASTSQDVYVRIDALQYAIQDRVRDHRRRIDQLNREIAGAQAENTMSEAQEQIAELFTQIHHLRSGATESEIIVRDITRDIKNLDIAKKNITSSITGIKRFQMLLVAFDQLQKHQGKGRRYKESSQALSAVKELASHFRSFSSIDRISSVLQGIQRIQGSIRLDVMKDFEAVLGRTRDGTVSSNPEDVTVSQLSDACLVIDAIGEDARRDLLEWYCNQQLREYRRIFRPSEEAGQLDNLSRRFAWFRRLIKMYEEEQSRIFPSSWKVPACLCGAFSAATKDDLKSVLVRVASGLTVNKLLEALNATTDFEVEMARKMGLPFEKITNLSPITHGSAIVSISSVFEPYLGIFVDAQDRTLSDMISGWRNHKNSTEIQRQTEGEEQNLKATGILPSSTELFYFYRETLESCAKLSTKATFLELCNVYKKWLKVYAEEVLGGALSKADRRSIEGRLNRQEVLQACSVLNTADYCAETTLQLEERLRQKIHADFADRVSLDNERELFTTVTAAAILALLKELEFSCEPAFNSMLKSPWKDSTIVSSESQYIVDLTESINQVADIVKTEVEHRKYYRSFCDKAVGLILARFTQTIVRARPISTIGAEQILLDVQRLKSCLLHFPKLAGEGAGSTALASYKRMVTKGLGKIDIILQVMMSPENPAEAFVDHYLVLIPCQSFSDFQKMLDLKGVRRTEQNNLLDIFLAKTSLLRDLSDSSVLTGIEMDSAASAAGTNASTTGGSLTPFSGLQGISFSSPNSALAHNLNTFIGSLPSLPGHSSSLSLSSAPSRSGTPQVARSGSDQGDSSIGSSSKGFKGKLGRLFVKDVHR